MRSTMKLYVPSAPVSVGPATAQHSQSQSCRDLQQEPPGDTKAAALPVHLAWQGLHTHAVGAQELCRGQLLG